MIRDWRLAICAVLSVGGHFALAEGLSKLPKHRDPPATRIVSLRVVSPPLLEPPPEPAAAPEAPAPKPVPHERPRAHTAPPPTQAPPPTDAPPPEHPAVTGAGPGTPVFGVTMESTSQAGTGPAMPVGNPGGAFAPPEDAVHKGPKAPPPPVPVYEVTKMPIADDVCQSRKPPYNAEAKQAGLEGTVVLDLIVTETGRVRDVRVVSGLGHGLTEEAIETVKKCHFIPGEKNGTPVPVRVSGFKYRFVLSDTE